MTSGELLATGAASDMGLVSNKGWRTSSVVIIVGPFDVAIASSPSTAKRLGKLPRKFSYSREEELLGAKSVRGIPKEATMHRVATIDI